MALLGEMTPLGGRLLMSKDAGSYDAAGNAQAISYAAQAPWLRHQSIRENILFGAPFDEERYDAVVDACALAPDLRVLEDGDATEIGARGVSLSGGQKARVALARAVYARTRYVLLDDPLSAVDAHTARALVERLLGGPLLAGRTVVLVTHHVALVAPGAHFLVRMLDGRVDAQGSVPELRAAGVLAGIESGEQVEAAEQEQRVAEGHEAEAAADGGVAEAEAQETGKAQARKAPRKLVEQEKREEGSVKWAIYQTYLRAS
jgi:ABC-type multidrug transport system fused ATPase/permease subunit